MPRQLRDDVVAAAGLAVAAAAEQRNEIVEPAPEAIAIDAIVQPARRNIFDELMDADPEVDEPAAELQQEAARWAEEELEEERRLRANVEGRPIAFMGDPGHMPGGFAAIMERDLLAPDLDVVVANNDPLVIPPLPPRPEVNPAQAERDRIFRQHQDAVMRFEVHRARGGGARRGARVREDEGRELPADVVAEPLPRNNGPLPAIPKKAPPRAVKKHVYPEGGVMYLGYKFSRKLGIAEDQYLRELGYAETLKMWPDLKYVEKEKPLDDTEEVIILMSELADHYATEECERTIEGFNIKDHNKEYQVVYKKHLKAITGFKRNKNG